MNNHVINIAALEPLFAPHEEPTKHRVRAPTEGEPAKVIDGRRPSNILIAQNLRREVKNWRELDYPSASDTTRELLYHWFFRDHLVNNNGESFPFKYYFCQREAIETLIYLLEVRSLNTISSIIAEFGGPDKETAALGIDPNEDRWSRLAFKLATGSGKTKVMSLAVVWGYFHALRESYSNMTKHFVVVAPNLTVFERLKDDFANGKIFDTDPLIPAAWRGDWNLSVALQDEASGANTGGVLYLTNIHRLYDPSRRNNEEETYSWAGPKVSKSKALDIGETLRERITSHHKLMVLNDEAHHLWDADSAWNEAVNYLHETINKRGGEGIVTQLDFSATPKDDKGQLFKHVVCDTPLGEAVDAGIVKIPIIGRGQKLIEAPNDDAAYKYEQHLRIGYERWKKSKEEWEKSGKKPLMFVMTEDTEAANQIAERLNSDPTFKELNKKTINLHTRLKGKIKKIGKGPNAKTVFVEDEKGISDEDLKELRKLSRELDSGSNPYCCIVSVLMLREGWDVKNVTTIVPLRPYSSKANILPEQTLGRGLRRMTPPGANQANETVTVVEHNAFVNLYKDELDKQGLPVEIVDVEQVPRTTITIFVDDKKDLKSLDIQIPRLKGGYGRNIDLESLKKNLTIEDIKKEFSKYKPLPIGERGKTEIEYEGRHLFTNEVIEQMSIQLPLLKSGVGAISFFRMQVEKIAGLKGVHQVLASLLEEFITNVLFEEKLDINDQRLVGRLADADVGEHIRAVFVPLIRSKTTFVQDRLPESSAISVCAWKPFQVTLSERKPALPASKTPFNLVTCSYELEAAMTNFLERAPDVISFCKNTGPECLKIDYLNMDGRISFYVPDFIVRMKGDKYVLIETKGRVEREIAFKARAAQSWCESVKWEYVFVPEDRFQNFGSSNKLSDLIRYLEPSKKKILEETTDLQLRLKLEDIQATRSVHVELFIKRDRFDKLPSRYKLSIEHSISLYEYLEKKKKMSFAPIFVYLLGPLDEAAKGLIYDTLIPYVPVSKENQKTFFEPYYGDLPEKDISFLKRNGNNLKRTLIDRNGLWPSGLLMFCLSYPKTSDDSVDGVFRAVRETFASYTKTSFPETIKEIVDFRNNYVAHQNVELLDSKIAFNGLKAWINGIAMMYEMHTEQTLESTYHK